MAQTIKSMIQIVIDYRLNKYGHYVATFEQVEEKLKKVLAYNRILVNNHVLRMGKKADITPYVTHIYLDGKQVIVRIKPNYL